MKNLRPCGGLCHTDCRHYLIGQACAPTATYAPWPADAAEPAPSVAIAPEAAVVPLVLSGTDGRELARITPDGRIVIHTDAGTLRALGEAHTDVMVRAVARLLHEVATLRAAGPSDPSDPSEPARAP